MFINLMYIPSKQYLEKFLEEMSYNLDIVYASR